MGILLIPLIHSSQDPLNVAWFDLFYVSWKGRSVLLTHQRDSA